MLCPVQVSVSSPLPDVRQLSSKDTGSVLYGYSLIEIRLSLSWSISGKFSLDPQDEGVSGTNRVFRGIWWYLIHLSPCFSHESCFGFDMKSKIDTPVQGVG